MCRLGLCSRTRWWTICLQVSRPVPDIHHILVPSWRQSVMSSLVNRVAWRLPNLRTCLCVCVMKCSCYHFSSLVSAISRWPPAGTPAYMSKKVQKGDEILEVDGQPVNQGNLRSLLVGCDVPGSLVNIKLQRGGKYKMLTLKRGKQCVCVCINHAGMPRADVGLN